MSILDLLCWLDEFWQHLRGEFPHLLSYTRFVELLLAFCLTPGNVDDRRPVPRLVRRLFGRLFGDHGYISQELAEDLLVTQGVQLITKLRNRLLALGDKLLLRKRALIESLVDELKNVCQTLAFAPSQSTQLSGEPHGRAYRLLPSAQEPVAGSRPAGPACGRLAYPELT
jgi:hypothetical protein